MVNRRASLNRLIETSCIPELWITNNAEVLDPAVLRRFDVVIQLEAMPRSAKLSLMKESLLSMPGTAAVQSDSAVSAPAMERWAEIDALSPALIERLAQVRQKAMSQGVAFCEVLCAHWLKHRLSDSTRAQRKLVVLATNRLDALDVAVLRRMDAKIHL